MSAQQIAFCTLLDEVLSSHSSIVAASVPKKSTGVDWLRSAFCAISAFTVPRIESYARLSGGSQLTLPLVRALISADHWELLNAHEKTAHSKLTSKH